MSSRNPAAHRMQGLELLEPRSLFSSYLYHSPADAFGVNVPIHDLQAPGIDVLGFGAFVAALGDIDGDGFGDFAVSSTGAAPEGGGIIAEQQGQVFLYSGHTASLIRTLSDGAWEFGASFANVGDLNNDGVPDLLVGSPRFDGTDNSVSDPTGRACLFSGIDGAVLLTIEGATPFGDFGRVVSGLNDANADDVRDFLISAPGTTADLTGSVFIYSGADGSLLRTFNGEAAGDRFGAAIAVASDDVEDHDLFAVGAPFNDLAFEDSGRIYVYRNDGTNVLTVEGASAGEQFGAALAIAQNLQTLDPVTYIHRLIVGSPGYDSDYYGGQCIDCGRATSFELATGASRTTSVNAARMGARFGARLTAIADFTTPGEEDIAIAAPGTGLVYTATPWLNGLNIQPQPLVAPTTVLSFVMASAGDVNNDGIVDIISSDGHGRVTVVSSLAAGVPIAISGASPDGRYVWTQSYYVNVLFIDGVAHSYSHVPGLSLASHLDLQSPTSQIVAIGNDGAIVFFNYYLDGSPNSELMISVAGQVATLQSMITATEGEQPTDFSTLKVVDISDGGDILLTESTSQFPNSGARTWIFSNGTLSFLWTGFAFDVNTSGTVVGQLQQFNVPAQSVMWAHASGITVIPELDGSLLINDAGEIFGTRHATASSTTPGTIARWAAGVVTDITAGPEFGGQYSITWILRAIDGGGRIIADLLTVNGFSAPQLTTYVFQPGDGLRTFDDATHGTPQLSFGTYPASFADSVGPTRILADGRIITYNAILTDIDDRDFAVIRPGSQTAAITKYNGDRYVAAINQYNELIVFHYHGASWTVRRIGEHLVSDSAEIVMFGGESPMTDTFITLADDGALSIFDLDAYQPTALSLLAEMRTPIVRNLTVFTNTPGVVHLVGLNADGDLVVYFRNTSPYVGLPYGWNYVNLTETHFQPQGMATPVFASHFTAFSTSWNGMNIAGLDAQGHVQVAWWAPGITLWQMADLTTSAQGASAVFTGEVSAFVTPWNTMHINGILSTTGETTALWWAPGFGANWRTDELAPGGLPLLGSSITAYVTPWAALNVAGLNAQTGQLDVYWWTPTTNQWVSEPVLLFAQPLVGRLDSYVEIVGSTVTQTIFGQAEDGSLLRFSWTPGDTQWGVSNLTDLV